MRTLHSCCLCFTHVIAQHINKNLSANSQCAAHNREKATHFISYSKNHTIFVRNQSHNTTIYYVKRAIYSMKNLSNVYLYAVAYAYALSHTIFQQMDEMCCGMCCFAFSKIGRLHINDALSCTANTTNTTNTASIEQPNIKSVENFMLIRFPMYGKTIHWTRPTMKYLFKLVFEMVRVNRKNFKEAFNLQTAWVLIYRWLFRSWSLRSSFNIRNACNEISTIKSAINHIKLFMSIDHTWMCRPFPFVFSLVLIV